MKKIVFNHKGQFTHLFLSFSEQVVKSHNLLMGIGTPVEFELRLSLGDRHIMVNDRVGLKTSPKLGQHKSQQEQLILCCYEKEQIHRKSDHQSLERERLRSFS